MSARRRKRKQKKTGTPSTTQRGTNYEQIVWAVFQAMNKSGLAVDVEHNVKKIGRSGCAHQIDVYWEFTTMGQPYRTAVECKNFGKAVSIGRVRDFFGVLHDLGTVVGIVVTTVGFQSGAKEFADHYQINTLVIPRAP